jgi:GT2 family glycosyltransferase
MIGACIVSYNSAVDLPDCISYLKRAQIEVIVVVDNASSDESVPVVQSRHPDVLIIQSSTNTGYARANNIGCRALLKRGVTYLLVVNPDSRVSPEMPGALAVALEQHQHAGCAGGSAVDPGGGHARASFRNRPTLADSVLIYGRLRDLPLIRPLVTTALFRRRSAHYVRPATTSPTYAVSGACFMARAPAFMEIGGFDESTFLHNEELILSERLHSKQWTVLAVPNAHYSHAESTSLKRHPWWSWLGFVHSEQILWRRYYRRSFAATALLVLRLLETALWPPLEYCRRVWHRTMSCDNS